MQTTMQEEFKAEERKSYGDVVVFFSKMIGD